jgi:hypothetical protein
MSSLEQRRTLPCCECGEMVEDVITHPGVCEIIIVYCDDCYKIGKREW